MTETIGTLLNMPDLPELESIEAGSRKLRVLTITLWTVLAIIAGAACGGIYALARVGSHTPFAWTEFAVVAIVGAVITAVWMTRTSMLDCHWTTDSTGIRVRSPFRERRVEWSAVNHASGKAALGGTVVCTLRTTSGKVTISDLYDDGPSGAIGASIYQHLRKYGKADESLLSPGARTFWIPIPKDVPVEMDWHNPHPPDWSITLIIAAVVVIGVPLIYILGPRVDWGRAWSHLHQFAAFIIPLGYNAFRERLIAARSAAVRQDGIELRTARRLLYLPWLDVHYVQWNQQHNTLAVGRSCFKDVATIRYSADDPDSGLLILSIVRQLRAIHRTPPVAIPKPLLQMLGGGAALLMGAKDDHTVEVRVARATLIAGAIGIGTLGTLAAIAFSYGSMNKMLLGVLALWLIAYLPFAGRLLTAYKADAEGLTVTRLGRRKLIRWQEIASYVVRPATLMNCARRTLRDSAGRTLAVIAITESTTPGADLLLAYLDEKLAGVRQEEARVMMR